MRSPTFSHLRLSQPRAPRDRLNELGSHNEWGLHEDEEGKATQSTLKLEMKGVGDRGRSGESGRVIFLPWLNHLSCFAGNNKRDRAASVPQGSFDGFSGPQHLL